MIETPVSGMGMRQLSHHHQDAIVEFISTELEADKNWLSTVPEIAGGDPFSWTIDQIGEYIEANYSKLVIQDAAVKDLSFDA